MSALENISVNTDATLLDINFVQSFLENDSYWARERSLEQTKTAIQNSICFGVYDGDKQIGFARVISDKATFAYLGDVFIVSEYQGRGIGKMLMAAIIEHPELQGLRRWILATRDAHGLYEQFGFHGLKFPERWMELPAPNAY